MLSPDEERELVKQMRTGEVDIGRAETRLLESNLHVVVSIVRRRTSDDGTCLKLIQQGNEVLVRAVRSFDPSSGEVFSTYARRRLEQEFGTEAG